MPTSRPRFIRTLRARWLGHCMRQIREERGLTLKDVAAEIGIEFSTLARLERAEWPFRRDQYVEPLLDVYGIYDQTTRDDLLQLACRAWQIHQWHLDPISDAHPTPRDSSIRHQPPLDWIYAQAEQICPYAALTIPDLLQTNDYTYASLRSAAPDADDSSIEAQVHQRMRLQDILVGSPPPRLCAILDEQVLHRPAGGVEILAAQLDHLRHLTDRPDRNIEIRILPTQASQAAGIDGPFVALRMSQGHPPVTIVPHLGGHLVIEATLAQQYDHLHERLTADALSPSESLTLVETRAKELA
ncbi:helix-turn-helix domain-containing protein [Phytohabitans rumicis]